MSAARTVAHLVALVSLTAGLAGCGEVVGQPGAVFNIAGGLVTYACHSGQHGAVDDAFVYGRDSGHYGWVEDFVARAEKDG